jgi:hypothetical protein
MEYWGKRERTGKWNAGSMEYWEKIAEERVFGKSWP